MPASTHLTSQTEINANETPGTVIAQTPKADSMVDRTTKIQLMIAEAPPPPTTQPPTTQPPTTAPPTSPSPVGERPQAESQEAIRTQSRIPLHFGS